MNRDRIATNVRRGPRKRIAPDRTGSGTRDEILRFRRTEILLHWSIAGPFLACYLSALGILAGSTLGLDLPIRPALSWIHRIAGSCLVALPPLVLLATRREWRLHLYNIRQAWIWTLEDARWLLSSGLAAVNAKVHLPEQGKFNAGEKLNFMMVMTTYPLFILTGILIWLPGTAFYAWLFHVAIAAAATPLLLGHLFMAVVNPDTRIGLKGMITGRVDGRWAAHHYARWYRENSTGGPASIAEGGAGTARGKPAGASPKPAAPPPQPLPEELELEGLEDPGPVDERGRAGTSAAGTNGPSRFENLRFVERKSVLSAPPGGRQAPPDRRGLPRPSD